MRKVLVGGGKLIIAIAASWAVCASIYIFTSPVLVEGVTGLMSRETGTVVEAFSREQSWYEAQGVWGVLWLAVFGGLYLAAVRVAWTGAEIALVILSVAALGLSVVTGFSIGGVYLPASYGLLIGTLMILSAKLLRAQC